MRKILVADNIAPQGLAILCEAGEVQERTGLPEAELTQIIGDFDAIVVRSATQVTAPVIAAGHKLRVIARAGVGVDNVNVAAATRHGVLVVNSPGGNTVAAAEHTLAMMLAAARMIPQASQSLKQGHWDRKSFMGRQISGKTLGIVGMGKIGSEVARCCQALGMRVLVYDPYVSAEQAESAGVESCALDALLGQADIVTVHAPLTSDTCNIISAERLALMKPDAILVNCARGGLVDESALRERLKSGQLAAAALDVFETEPTPDEDLVGLPNVIATPHIAASTHEAQVNVAVDVARQVVDVLAGRHARWVVNAPALSTEAQAAVEPLVPLARALGQLLHALWPAAVQRAELRSSSDLAADYLNVLNQHFLVGLLEDTVDEPVNYVNVRALAEERGIEVASSTLAAGRGYSRLLEGITVGAGSTQSAAGALVREHDARITSIDGYSVDIVPAGTLMLIWNSEPGTPGFVGRFGTLTGCAGMNILSLQVAGEERGGRGLMAVNLGGPVEPMLAAQILDLPGVERIVTVHFTV